MLLNEYVASLLTPLGGSFYIKAPLTFGLLIPALPIIAIQTMIQLWISFTLFLLGVKRVMQSAQYEWQDGAKVINVRKWEKKKSTKPRIHQHNSLYLFVLANRHCVYHFHTLSLNCLMFFKLLSSFFFFENFLNSIQPFIFGLFHLIHSLLKYCYCICFGLHIASLYEQTKPMYFSLTVIHSQIVYKIGLDSSDGEMHGI